MIKAWRNRRNVPQHYKGYIRQTLANIILNGKRWKHVP
jgi:hypothetical protein